MDKFLSADRELDLRCKIIYDLTKEVVENETVSNKRFYFWAYHEIWTLQAFPKCLASKKAYELFYKRYKKDIREFDWFSDKIRSWKDNNNKRQFMHEHLTTSEDFKQELIYLYKNNQLSIDKIKELIGQQRICWITREEDDILKGTKTYKSHRPNPLLAYKECGIEIYEEEKADLDNIMIPTFDSDTNKIRTEDFSCNSINDSKKLLEEIKNEISKNLTNFNIHYSMSYIQIWKSNWNNQGKRGLHFELSPKRNKGFSNIYRNEEFVITFKLHNEENNFNFMPQIPKTKFYFKKQYSFSKQSIKKSIKELIIDVKKMIDIDELNIDMAHEEAFKIHNKKMFIKTSI